MSIQIFMDLSQQFDGYDDSAICRMECSARELRAMAKECEDMRKDLAECRENGDRLFEAADGWKLVAAEANRKAEDSAKQIRILEIKNAGSLANNLCPDHRDKQAGKPCLACLLETAEKRAEAAEAAEVDAARMREAIALANLKD